MLIRFFVLLGVLSAIGLGVLYHRPTAKWLQAWQLNQQIDTLLRQRNWQGLRQLCERQYALTPNHAGVLKGLAAYYTYKGNDPHIASRYYDALLQQTPMDHGARLAYANLLRLKLLQPDNALRVLYQGTQLAPEGTAFPHQMGNIYLQAAEASSLKGALLTPESKRLYTLANQYYQSVLARKPDHYGAMFQAGRVASALHQWDHAADYFCQCTLLAPTSYRAWYNLGYALLPLGLTDAGQHVLSTAIHLPSVDEATAVALMRDAHALDVHYGQPHGNLAPHRSGVMGAIGASDWHQQHAENNPVPLPNDLMNSLPVRLQACLKKQVIAK
jgi:hypothetical protein